MVGDLCGAIFDVGSHLGFLVLHRSLLSVRLSFYHSLGLGSGPNSGATVGELEPNSKSADEIHALCAYLAKQMES